MQLMFCILACSIGILRVLCSKQAMQTFDLPFSFHLLVRKIKICLGNYIYTDAVFFEPKLL